MNIMPVDAKIYGREGWTVVPFGMADGETFCAVTPFPTFGTYRQACEFISWLNGGDLPEYVDCVGLVRERRKTMIDYVIEYKSDP